MFSLPCISVRICRKNNKKIIGKVRMILACLRHLSKIHKKDVPFRIIASSVNATIHLFVSCLQKILKENLPKVESHNNSFDLCIELSDKMIECE